MKRIIFLGLTLLLAGYTAPLRGQVDTDFWFVVPEISHRGSTGGTPGTLRFATLELEATVTIEMPANPGFTPIVLDIPANDAAAVDLTYLIDDVTRPGVTGLENKPLTPTGINSFGLHITSTNMINAYWEVNHIYGADVWTLKGSNGLGTLFYTPFQTEYPNHLTVMPSLSAIDVVASQDNTTITFTLPDGVGASYGEPISIIAATTPGSTFSVHLDLGETFSLFPFLKSTAVSDKLAGTRIESTNPIAVVLKDDNLNTASQGRSTIGDQIVPVNITGDTYVVPAMGNPNLSFVVATQDNTNIYINDPGGVPTLYATLDEGEQVMVQSPNNTIMVISSKNGMSAPAGPPFYVFHMAINNMTRAAALLPPIGCTGNTQLAFTRAREAVRENFYFFVITEDENIDDFLIDGAPADPTIISNDASQWDRLGNGWSVYESRNIPASKLARGQHLMENSGGNFHLGIISGYTSSNLGDLLYGYCSDYGGLNVGAVFASTNSSVIRVCLGTPVQLHAYGGTTYEWTPHDYLDDPYSNLPTAINLPAGAHQYTTHVSGTCGSGDVPLTVIVAPPVTAQFEPSVTSGCSPLEVVFEDRSEGNVSWQYDLGDGSPLILYDTLPSTSAIVPPPDPFTFSHVYTNPTDSPVEYEITLIARNAFACYDIISRTITVLPEIHSDFVLDHDNGCQPLEVQITNNSWGDISTMLWDFGDGTTSTSSAPVLNHTYVNNSPFPITYTITLQVDNAEGCTHQTQREVTIYPGVNADFIPNTTEACSPAEFTFTNISTGATTYHWDFGDGGSSTEEHPTHYYDRNLLDRDTSFTVWLVSSTSELCRDSAMVNLVIHPYIEAVYTIDDVVGCTPFNVEIRNESIGADINYWDFGDGAPVSNDPSALINHTYLNTTSSTVVYPLRLIVNNFAGCSDTVVSNITVHPEITANFSTDKLNGCHPLTVTFTDLSANAVNYLWDFGDGTTSVQPSPAHTYSNSGISDSIYTVTLTTSSADGECVKSISWPITVHPLVVADFTFPEAQGCGPFEVTFENQSTGGDQFTWDFGDGTIVNTATTAPQTHTFVNSGFSDNQDYSVSLHVQNAEGCSNEVVKTVSVSASINSDFAASSNEGCSPLNVDFVNQSRGGNTYIWDFGDGTTSNLVNPDHLFTNTTSNAVVYTVKLYAVASNNVCTDSTLLDITVYPTVHADFTMSEMEGCHPFVAEFQNLSENASVYRWVFGDGNALTTVYPNSQSHTYLNNNLADQHVIEVSLEVENDFGCIHETMKTVTIYRPADGGILTGGDNPIVFGSSTGTMTLQSHYGDVVSWQKRLIGSAWSDINHSETAFSEVPVSAGLWIYRVQVRNETCPIAYSDSVSIMVEPKEVVISPVPDQEKKEGDADPVFSFTNSEWNDNSNFTGQLDREPGETPDEYEYLLGNLSAGSNHTLAMSSDVIKFTIVSTVGIEEYTDSNGLSLSNYSNPFRESTIFRYSLPFEGRVTLSVYNTAGQLVKTVINNKPETKGEYRLGFGDTNIKAGIYFAILTLESDHETVSSTIKLIKSR